MEEMDIEMVVDIPDSPDRMGACHISDAARTGRDSNSSVPGHSRDSTVMKEERFKRARDRGGLVSESGLNGRLHLNFRKNVTKGIESGNRSIGFSPLENANTSQTAPLFRRTAVDNNSRNENTSIGALHMDRGKATSTKFPSKAFTRPKRNAFIGSNKQSGHEQLLEMAFPRGASRSSLAEGVKEGQGTACVGSSLPGAQCSLKVADNTSKGKEKIGNYMYEGAGLASDAKGIDLSRESQDKMDKQISLSHQPVVSPRITGQKRLVRNGCISPHLIAARAKLLAQDDDNSREADNFDQSCAGNVVSNNQTLKDIREIVADENISDRVKGKRVVHPHTSRERDTKIIHLSNSPNTNDEEASGTSDANGYAVGFSKGLGGWGSTRSRHYEQLSERAGHPFGRNNMNENAAVGRDNRRERNDVDACNNPIDLDATQTGYRRTPDLVPSREHCHFSKSFVRRQQKNGLNSENHGASSRMVVNDPEIVFLCSSGESSSSRCSRIHNRQCQGMSDPVLEIDGSPPDVRLSYSERFGCANNEEADARARQVEADERLARELQEQLYQEVSVFESNEIDENVAWALQQEEDALHVATTQDHRPLHHRTSSIPHPRRQPRSQSSRSSSNSRVNLAQAPTSVRMRQLRGSMFSRSPAASSRVRNLRFPSHMDLDMRLDILEALEAAVGELSDSMGTNSHILQIQRDFNENDYEMLLALDENNDQHVGASVNQINSLPQSTVQTGNFGEDCAICLETPTVGEAIRHLPCLHKFHKDCIDPWLSRRTSCPVCKSSINLN